MQLLEFFEYTQAALLVLISVEMFLCTYMDKSNIILAFFAIPKICIDILHLLYLGQINTLGSLMIASDILILLVFICDSLIPTLIANQAKNYIINIFRFVYSLLLIAIPIMVIVIAYLIINQTAILLNISLLILMVCLFYKSIIIFATLLIKQNRLYKEKGVSYNE